MFGNKWKPFVHPKTKFLYWIWKLNLMPKIKIFLWLVIREALPICKYLKPKRIEIINVCYLCNESSENINHIFRKLVIREALPICKYLKPKRIEIINMCYLCNESSENINHIFRKCPLWVIWDRMNFNGPTLISYEGEFLSWLEMVDKNYKINCKF